MEDCAEKLDSTALEYGERIRTSAARMDQMIQELLSYSRLTLMEFEAQPVKLSRVYKDVLSQLSWEIEQRKASVQCRRSATVIRGHYVMVVQVIANLVSNGLKFMPEGITPVVKVYDEPADGKVRIWVEDNGIGIAPEHCQRIFRIFERLHGREIYSGTGIGLAIVEKAIARMNGRVGVESELGKGSRFWVELPACSEAEGKPETSFKEKEKSPAAASTEGMPST
jgi:signal transduction histidine kinase